MSFAKPDEQAVFQAGSGAAPVPCGASAAQSEPMPTEDEVRLGQWYWVRSKAQHDRNGVKKGDTISHLCCVTALASNHAVLTTPRHDGGSTIYRVRFGEFVPPQVEYEPNSDAVIAAKVSELQAHSAHLIGEVTALMARLGLGERAGAIEDKSGDAPRSGLMVLSGADDIDAYKRDLIRAKDTDLPSLFAQIEHTNKSLAAWMTAPTLALQAQMGPLKERVKSIEDRIFSVELYAGLTERVLQLADGRPAAADDKLHVMQRRLYMDEECLAAYSDGGMDIRDLGEFDVWLARPENRDRLLPWPRCLVAMRVRRNEKLRECGGSLRNLLENVSLAEADKRTFLFLRNGEQVWRLSCDLEFGEMLFPDADAGPLSGPLMVRRDGLGFWSRPAEKLMPVALYEQLSSEYEDWQARAKAWIEQNPDVEWISRPHWVGHGGPRRSGDFRPSDWEPLTPDSLEYDKAMETLSKEVAAYNRICLIIQGLFDRSPVLHPHHQVRLWTAAGFDAAITLVYDKTRALYASADPPDFEAYRRRCNAGLRVGSIITGAEPLWTAREAEKENRRLDSDWRRTEYRHTHFRPYGDPGPGSVSTVASWSGTSRRGTVRWVREARRQRSNGEDVIEVSIKCSTADILNVSAYRPGDYKQFFADPRTRENYLQWAPLLLAAEDWHAGRLKERGDCPGAWDHHRRR